MAPGGRLSHEACALRLRHPWCLLATFVYDSFPQYVHVFVEILKEFLCGKLSSFFSDKLSDYLSMALTHIHTELPLTRHLSSGPPRKLATVFKVRETCRTVTSNKHFLLYHFLHG